MYWWQYKAPVDSCWYWKTVCALKDNFAPAGYVQNGGYVANIEFWRCYIENILVKIGVD